MPHNIGYATDNAKTPLKPFEFDRPKVGPEDVLIDIAYCGVCHSDVHQARDELSGDLATNFPCMPGHEIAGTVAEIGEKVTRYKVGDRVGVGCLVYWGDESQRGVEDEQYQDPPAVFTYNAKDPDTGTVTFGGYSDQIVVHEHFVLQIPDSIKLENAAPILCAGVTTWAPLKRLDVGPGTAVAIAGFGGLGHMATKLAKARGADKVIVLTTSGDKAEAAKKAGADEVLDMTDEKQVEDYEGVIDCILSTIPTAFDMKPYLNLLTVGGTLMTVGMLEPIHEGGIDFGVVSLKRLSISGSLIGNLNETQEVLDFCAEHDIAADVTLIDVKDINEVFDTLTEGDISGRYVIDMATLANKS